MELLIPYTGRIAAGFAAIALLLLALPRRATALRIAAYIGLFILLRDAMTPEGLWFIGGEAFFWMRWAESGALLWAFGALTALVTGGILLLEPELRRLTVWTAGRPGEGALTRIGGVIALGLLGAVIAAAPLLLIYSGVPVELRGGAVAASLVLPILWAALLGNLFEETLFRGFLQGYLRSRLELSPLRAAVLSGLAFSAGHVFLASVVTEIGAPLLLFTAYEGILCGIVRMRRGTLAAALTHGGAILLLTWGVV
jgi:hypothetical protein